MSTTPAPPPGEEPQKLELKDLMPAQAPKNGTDWKAVGAGVGAVIAILGGIVTTFKTGSADQSAQLASHAVIVTTEMIQTYRDRTETLEKRVEHNERRIEELEKQVALLEAKK